MRHQTPPLHLNEALNPFYLTPPPQPPKLTLDGQSGPTGGDTTEQVPFLMAGLPNLLGIIPP